MKINCDLVLLIVRLLLGITLILHGAQKVFGVFGGNGLEAWKKYITSQNIPFTNTKFPDWMAVTGAFVELIAGLFILLGIFTKMSSIASIIFLVFAILIAHLPKGYFIQNGGSEFAVNLIVLSVILVIAGGGKYSLLPRL